MSSDSSSSGSNSFGSAIATGLAGFYQFSLLNNKGFMQAAKDLAQSQIRFSVASFKLSQKLQSKEGSEVYNKTLVFEGCEIPPAARDDLFKRIESDDNYDSFNSFERRLANWITESNPYENNVESPLPPASPIPHNAKSLLQLGTAVCLVITAVVAIESAWYVGGVMALILGMSYDKTIRQMNKASEKTETYWLIPFINDATVDPPKQMTNEI